MAAVFVLAVSEGALAAAVPGVPWTQFLPALPSPPQDHPNRIAHCKRPAMKCVRVEIRRMRAKRDRLGCDHRAVFTTTYLELTKELRDRLRADPHLLHWKKFFFREDALFADVYFRSLKRWKQGKPVPEAWRIAFETAHSGEVTGAQDMLLGINAHVQNDMPFVVAELGLETPDGKSRKPDHDVVNAVLEMAYQRVVDEVERRYDPILAFTNPDGTTADDTAGLELVRGWREGVWRNAERLTNAKSEAERRQVADSIEANANEWAQGIAAFQTPGDRERRDAYCQAQLEAEPMG